MALRLFLFFVPLLVFVVGIAGFVSTHVGSDDVDTVGITGGLARQINEALTQPSSSRWFAVGVGLFGMLTTGRTLSRVMTVASCLSWRLPPRPKASVRSIGGMVGLIAGIGLVAAIVNKIRHDLGIGVATVSFARRARPLPRGVDPHHDAAAAGDARSGRAPPRRPARRARR